MRAAALAVVAIYLPLILSPSKDEPRIFQRPGASLRPAGAAVLAEQSIDLPRPAELRAVVTGQCAQCAWDVEGREAVTLTISVDGHYSQQLPLVRGGSADYNVMLGAA